MILPEPVREMADKLADLYPRCRIETEQVWFVRAVEPIETSNIGHTITRDARMVRIEEP